MTLRPATTLVQGGIRRSQFGETSEALYLTSGFVFSSAEEAEATFAGTCDRFQYSRFGNPTLTALEERLARLEGAEACVLAASGMAAVNAVFMSHLKPGDRVVAARALFGTSHAIVSTLLPRWGVETIFVNGPDMDQWRTALSRPTQLVLLESPSNPMLEIVDLTGISDLAHRAGAVVAVDNVFATPILQQPLRLGADAVIYSCTKHIDGQGRVMGGAILGRRPWIEDTVRPFIRTTGPILSVFSGWLLLKGLETLELRVKAACERAATLADFLAEHPQVTEVWYPARSDHPQHAQASRQMSAGGTVVTFGVAGGGAGAFRFLNALRLIAISANLGDCKSLACHPATTTHLRIGAEERLRLGITEGVIRLSVGLEDVVDLRDDLASALRAVPEAE